VTIDDQNALKTVMRQTRADIPHIFDERIPLDRQRAVEVHVMGTVAVGNRWRQYRLVSDARHGALTDSRAQHDICVYGQVRTMILIGRHGQHRHLARLGGVTDLIPDHLSETVFCHIINSQSISKKARKLTHPLGECDVWQHA
jgi:hypothetical protein